MIDLKIVTPQGRYLQEEVKSIYARSVMGDFTLLPSHMPVVMSLEPCKLVLTNDKDEKTDYAISGGILHFDDNKATLLTDAIEGKWEIDIPRAQAAYKRARARMEKRDSASEMKRTELAMRRAINRLHVADNHTANG